MAAIQPIPPVVLDPAPPAPGPGQRRRLLIIAGMSMLGPFSVDAYLPAMPAMRESLAASDATIQLTITTFMIGLALGQVVIGPLSDAVGRRRPLLIGLACYALGSLLCTLAPSADMLLALRFLQGVAASAGLVVSLAIVRDLYSGREAARFLSLVRTLSGAAPLAAPIIGAQVLLVTEWQGIFVVQAAFGLLLVAAVAAGLGETLPPVHRHPPRLGTAVRALGGVGRDPAFLSFALPAALMTGAAFSYISGSSFVFQDGYGLSAQAFSAVFALNVVCMVTGALVNALLMRRFGPERLLAFGFALLVGGPSLLLLVTLGTDAGVVGAAICLSVCLTGFGFANANAMALSIDAHPGAAGSAAGLFGILQFMTAAGAAPLAGLTNSASGWGLGLQMLTWAGAGTLLYIVLRRRMARKTAAAELQGGAHARHP